MNLLRSLASSNTKKQLSQPVNIGIVVLLVLLLIFRIPRDIHRVVTSVPIRIVWVLGILFMFSNYGVVSALLTALLLIVLLTDVQLEGMTNKETNDTKEASKDPVHDAMEKVKDKSAKKDIPPPKKEDKTPIETAVADANEQGTLSQVDKDRAMKLSSHVNSKDESIVEQMKKEKEQEKTEKDSKEGFAPMSFTNSSSSLKGSSF